MTRTHKLIKLRIETVENLKRLKADMGLACLDELVNVMIRLTDEYRFIVKGTGWYDPRKGYLNEKHQD
jgi:hypothetical protein